MELKGTKGFSKQLLEELLSHADTMICVDTRVEDVHVPPYHRDKADLLLILSLNFRHPIELLEEGIRATLLFAGEPFECWIPYLSLWGAYHPHTGEGYICPDTLPEEILKVLLKEKNSSAALQKQQEKKKGTGAKKAARVSLRIIPGGKSEEGEEGEEDRTEETGYKEIESGDDNDTG